LALAMGLFTLGTASNASTSGGYNDVSSSLVSVVIVVSLALQVVASAIFFGHRNATAQESATRRALGLDRPDETRALWWQQWLPQIIGLAVGLAFGLVLYLGLTFMVGLVDAPVNSLTDAGYGLRIGLLHSLVAASCVALLGAAVAWVGVRFRAHTSPVAALATAG